MACPTNDAASGALCEFADGFCFQQGTRTVLVNGVPATAVSARSNECFASRYQNGDLDFDGQSYLAGLAERKRELPDHVRVHRAVHRRRAYLSAGPVRDRCRRLVEPVQRSTGAGCTAPPISAKFYPFWSLSRAWSLGDHTAGCVWNFGNDQPTTRIDFGKDAQYGTPDLAYYGGTLISAPQPNPQVTGGWSTSRSSPA